MDNLGSFRNAFSWIEKKSIKNEGISITNMNGASYPEVTGYYIPTLIDWGDTDRALVYSKWLLSVQKEDGSWGGPTFDGDSYIFDTGQILKGLLRASEKFATSDFDDAMILAAGWIVSFIKEDGEISPPDLKGWAGKVPLGILLYTYEPILSICRKFQKTEWEKKVLVSIEWFLKKPDLVKFNALSHFHAYITEALCDLGHHSVAREGMIEIEKLQKRNGSVRGFSNTSWVCSTAMFQYSVVWSKLGNFDRAMRAFNYGLSLQNQSGGWYGSYGWFAKYFPKEEISWANKYFLDALRLILLSEFNRSAHTYSDQIDGNDERLLVLVDAIEKNQPFKVLDLGVGKGRYIKQLVGKFQKIQFFASDLNSKNVSFLPAGVSFCESSILDLPMKNGEMDFVYCIEVLEHAVNVDGAINEIFRVLKPGGTLLIIDKDIKKIGRLKLAPWEQWFDVEALELSLKGKFSEVSVNYNVGHDGVQDGLFVAWKAIK